MSKVISGEQAAAQIKGCATLGCWISATPEVLECQ